MNENTIEMQAVESSNIAEIGYDDESQRMRVKFRSGKTYEYEGVPLDLWQQFELAESFGSFFAKNVRPFYTGKVVEVQVLGESRTYGRVAYEAYGDNRKWQAYNGEPMPRWNDLPSYIQDAWEHAANAARVA